MYSGARDILSFLVFEEIKHRRNQELNRMISIVPTPMKKPFHSQYRVLIINTHFTQIGENLSKLEFMRRTRV